jgi:hypothetical protein
MSAEFPLAVARAEARAMLAKRHAWSAAPHGSPERREAAMAYQDARELLTWTLVHMLLPAEEIAASLVTPAAAVEAVLA